MSNFHVKHKNSLASYPNIPDNVIPVGLAGRYCVRAPRHGAVALCPSGHLTARFATERLRAKSHKTFQNLLKSLLNSILSQRVTSAAPQWLHTKRS